MATWAAATAERNRVMSSYPVLMKIRLVDAGADDYDVEFKDLRHQSDFITGYTKGSWGKTTVAISQVAFP